MNRLTRNILLIPGPLTTSYIVKRASPYDYSAREEKLIKKIKDIRENLLLLSDLDSNKWASVLFQGSGTYSNEAVISSLPHYSKIDVLSNGIYGERLIDICMKYYNLNNFLRINHTKQITGETTEQLIKNSKASHLAFVHNETTTGIQNKIEEICDVAKYYNKKIILDAISSFGGIPIDINKLDIDYLIGSSNKCLHGYPGIGFVISKKDIIEESKNNGKTLSLDLYNQYKDFIDKEQFRFTPPVQVINSLDLSIKELIKQGGVNERFKKYKRMNNIVFNELYTIGFKPYVPMSICSPIVTTYKIPKYIKEFDFDKYSRMLREQNIVLYPSPLNNNRVIRVGNIGDITESELYNALNIMKILINKV